jgi:hypothetical protein
MSQEPSALSLLQEQIRNLTSQVTELRELNAEAYRSLEERDSRIATLEALPESTTRIAELEGRIRDRTHYDKFTELAKGAKAKEAAIKHLWQVSGYQPEGDEPDEQTLSKLVADLRKSADYAFEPGESTVQAARDAAGRYTTPPPGGGRGQRNQGADGTIVTAEMRADPKFMLDPRNREIITQAAKEGRFK